MQRLRTLMFLAVLVLMLDSLKADTKNYASIKKYVSQVQLSTQHTETIGQPIISSQSQQNRKKSEQTLSAQFPEWKKINPSKFKTDPHQKIKGSFYVQRSQEDFSQYILQDEIGRESSLGSTYDGEELSLSAAADAQFSAWIGRLAHQRTMNETPLANTKTSLGLSNSFNHQFSEVGIEYQFGAQKRPVTYFTDLKNGERRARPANVQFDSTLATFQQVLHERVKSRLSLERSTQTDRPEALGYQVQTSLALSSKDFLRLGYREIAENDRAALKDDRGYFHFKGFESSFSRYLSYDWVLGVGYGLVLEQEDNPQTRRREQMAADTFLLETEYQSKSWIAKVKYQSIVSNINYSSQVFGGEFSWIF